jgi:ABC-2 type transport system permease protein
VAFTFLLLAGYFFASTVAFYNLLSLQAGQNPMLAQQLNFTDMVVRPFFLDISIVLLLVAPLLSMRLYAEEKKAGTIELLYTYPIADRAAVLAKFGAVLTAYMAILLGTTPGFILLSLISSPPWQPIISGYLGSILLGGAFLALGVFTSSVTQNQIIAAVLSFGALLLFWIIGWMTTLVGPSWQAVIQYLSVMQHFDSFSKGVLDSGDFIYYVSFILFFLFLALRQMESYRWRG